MTNWQAPGQLVLASLALVGCSEQGSRDSSFLTLSRSSLNDDVPSAAQATSELRQEFGALAGPSPDPTDRRPVLHTTVAGDRIVGTHLLSPGALARIENGNADNSIRDYLLTHARQYGLKGVTSRDHLSHLTLQDERVSLDPKGTEIRLLRYKQMRDGVPIADGDLTAVFWGGALKSLVGRLVAPNEQLPSTSPSVSAATASAKATEAAESRTLETSESRLEGLELWIEHRRLVYRFTIVPALENGQRDAVIVGRTRRVLVDAHEGTVLQNDDDSRNQAPNTVPGILRVYQPTSNDPRGTDVVDMNAQVSSMGNSYAPWQDVRPGYSPVVGYSQSLIWSGAYYYLTRPWSTTFTYSPSMAVDFRQQHNNYWVQLAVNTANINFLWFPPPAAYQYAKVTVLTDCNDRGGVPVTGDNGCWFKPLQRPSDGTANNYPKISCMCLPSTGGTGYTIGSANASTLETLFHESGHTVSQKYLGGGFRENPIVGSCDPGAEEGTSLEENIAGLYSQMMFLQEFNLYPFMQYASVPLHFLTGTDASLHSNNGDLRCYRSPTPTCDPANKYDYGDPLQQAYMEAALGVNCGSNPCFVMNDGALTDEARWALFYAIDVTSSTSGYVDFVANFLDYYYNSVGVNQWTNRWWVFNHHSLVGPEYGYSPCHND